MIRGGGKGGAAGWGGVERGERGRSFPYLQMKRGGRFFARLVRTMVFFAGTSYGVSGGVRGGGVLRG